MLVPPTTLRYPLPIVEIRDEAHAWEVISLYRRISAKVQVVEDQVVSNLHLLQAVLYLGIPEVEVIVIHMEH